MTEKLSCLNGLGPKSAALLEAIGIHTKADLIQAGAIPAYLNLKQHCNGISLNFLYALVGIVEDESWRDVAATSREALLLQVDGYLKLAETRCDSAEITNKSSQRAISRSLCKT